MSWQKEVDEIRRREALAKEMGGEERIKRQHDNGRLTVRERISALVDKNSFHEIGALAGKASYDENGSLQHSRHQILCWDSQFGRPQSRHRRR